MLKFASDFGLSSSVILSTLEIGDIYLSSIKVRCDCCVGFFCGFLPTSCRLFCLFVWLFVCLLVCLPVCLFACLLACLVCLLLRTTMVLPL